MAVAFENIAYRYLNRKGKPVFVPTDRCRKIGDQVMGLVRDRVAFDPHYYHFAGGAHIAALHALRERRFFARLDLRNFFYSVGRNRVKADLKAIGVDQAERFARWSCVPNPYDEPKYSLPYGFPQSPLLATLRLSRSALGAAIGALPKEVTRSIYIDDIAVASDDRHAVEEAFATLTGAVAESGFSLNEAKSRGPCEAIDLFNCDLAQEVSVVREDRVAEFYAGQPNQRAVSAFEAYCAQVAGHEV